MKPCLFILMAASVVLAAAGGEAARPGAAPVNRSAEWWSLRPLVRPAVPGGGHPVDAFVRAGLKARGLEPSPQADARTLIRRVTVDLTGLPPSMREVEGFVNDTAPAAYDGLVDRLLASPRLGERWARHWLDTVHFADSHGFEHDVLRPDAWRYRDYVIASFNRDTPWPRFIREQLAADVFFPGETTLIPALGFLGAGTYDMSAAGTAPQSFEYLDRDDLVTQTMAAFASTTANCARCHEHKFDPITQEDYFSLQAVFAGIGKGNVAFDADPGVAARRKKWSALREAAQRREAAVLSAPENAALVEAWEKERAGLPPWSPWRPEVFLSAGGSAFERMADDSLLAGGPAPDTDTYTLTMSGRAGAITALRLDLIPDDSLPQKGPGRAGNGNVHLSGVEVQVFRAGAPKVEKVAISRATADFNQDGFGIAGAIDGDAKSSWAIHPNEGRPHHAVFELAAPTVLSADDRLVLVLRQLQPGVHLLGRFRISSLDAPGRRPTALPVEVETALAATAPTRSEDRRLTVAAHALGAVAEAELAALPPLQEVWAAARSAKNERGQVTFAEPRTIRVLGRGDLDKPGPVVTAGALSAVVDLKARFDLPDSRDEGARRAALADWLADPSQPLAWRSIVNRVWHYHFGRGLCDTPSDFGRMGGTPSHPELLDWLAVWFRDDAGGSLKALHRLIVTSETYRQSSRHRDEAAAVDADNRLLWRMNRTRLDADALRDAIVAASGLMDATMGGPGVQHFKMSPGPQATPVLDYGAFDWNSPGASRRSIYRVVWRGIPDPFMDAMDFPDMGLLAPVRGFSASALQGLALFNHNLVLHHSAALAAGLGKIPSLPDRVTAVYRQTLLREPTVAERDEACRLAEKHGLAAVVRVVFNSNEFLFVD